MRDDNTEPVDVLLAEDDPGDVRLTREAFEEGQTNATLHVASDGVEVLDFLHGRDGYVDAPRPEMVLLDPDLPRKDGEKVLREIRNEPKLSRIPVVVVAETRAEDRVTRFYELQANAYLVKPEEPDGFVQLVRALEKFWFRFARLPHRDA